MPQVLLFLLSPHSHLFQRLDESLLRADVNGLIILVPLNVVQEIPEPGLGVGRVHKGCVFQGLGKALDLVLDLWVGVVQVTADDDLKNDSTELEYFKYLKGLF